MPAPHLYDGCRGAGMVRNRQVEWWERKGRVCKTILQRSAWMPPEKGWSW
jgi:hypothetical protein